jgi:two-component system CheB/CheR fusion protein
MKAARKPCSRATRILLVEDHENTLHVLAAALRHRGHDVTAVGTMRSALEAMHVGGMDLIVCDIGLPDGDGWQFMEIVRARHEVSAIAMSGFGAPADLKRSIAAGFAIHLVKPFDPDELYAAIGSLMTLSPQPEGARPVRSRARRARTSH